MGKNKKTKHHSSQLIKNILETFSTLLKVRQELSIDVARRETRRQTKYDHMYINTKQKDKIS